MLAATATRFDGVSREVGRLSPTKVGGAIAK